MILKSRLLFLLEKNGGHIIDNISQSEIEDYQYVKEHLHSTDVSEDEDLQARIGQLYQFTKHRIDLKTRSHFFSMLEKFKGEEEMDLGEVAEKFLATENRKSYQAKHFTTLSYLTHLLDENYGIYSASLGEMCDFSLPRGQLIGNYQKKVAFQEFYMQLTQLYREIQDEDALQNLLKVVRIKFFAHKAVLTPPKRVDLLVRSASDLYAKGKLLVSGKVNSPSR